MTISPYPKFLWPITVPTGGWTFTTNHASSVVPADTYDTIYDLLDELESQLDTDYPALEWNVYMSSIGVVSISADGAWTVTWGSTSDALSAALGFDETESVSSNVLSSTYQHLYGYYPGLLSYGLDVHKGMGNTNTRIWRKRWGGVRQRAGDGAMTAVTPASATDTLDLRFGLVRLAEVDDADRGLRAFSDAVVKSWFTYYPSRAKNPDSGILGLDYFYCKFAEGGEPRVQDATQLGFCTFSMTLTRSYQGIWLLID